MFNAINKVRPLLKAENLAKILESGEYLVHGTSTLKVAQSETLKPFNETGVVARGKQAEGYVYAFHASLTRLNATYGPYLVLFKAPKDVVQKKLDADEVALIGEVPAGDEDYYLDLTDPQIVKLITLMKQKK